jgi:hypothetical protein
VLERARELGQNSEHVFPNIGRGRPLSNMAMLKTLERLGRPELTAHGFRSTFRDWAAERTNFAGEVAEAALAHVVDDKTEAAYRRGDLFDKRRRLRMHGLNFAPRRPSLVQSFRLETRPEISHRRRFQVVNNFAAADAGLAAAWYNYRSAGPVDGPSHPSHHRDARPARFP